MISTAYITKFSIKYIVMVDMTNGRLDEIKDFASKNGMTESLEKVLKRFDVYENNQQDSVVTLYPDWAFMSLYFEWDSKNGQRIMNGGVIYHGPHDNGGDGGSPTFSVNLEPHHGWSIHT